MLHQVKNVLAKQASSTHDPEILDLGRVLKSYCAAGNRFRTWRLESNGNGVTRGKRSLVEKRRPVEGDHATAHQDRNPCAERCPGNDFDAQRHARGQAVAAPPPRSV